MEKKILVFEYDNNKFVGILEYKEGKLINLAGDFVYKFELLLPFEYEITHFVREPKSNISKMGFSTLTITLDKIIEEVVDKVVYYFLNKERIDSYKKKEKEYLDIVNPRLNETIDSLAKKNEELKEKIKYFKQKFKNKELFQKEYQFKRKEIQRKIDENNDLIDELKHTFLESPYFENEKLKEKFLIPYDKTKIKVKEVKTFEGLSKEEVIKQCK